MDANDSTDEVERVALVDADFEQQPTDVWEALCEQADQWLGAGSFIDPVVGGAVEVNDVATGTRRLGIVRAAEPVDYLVLDWWPAGDAEDHTTVTVTLLPVNGGTHVTITETLPRRLAAGASLAAPWRAALLSLALASVYA